MDYFSESYWSSALFPGIYTTNSPEAVRYVVEHSRANFVVVEDKEQLDKVCYYTIISRKLNVEVAMICIQIWGVRDELEHLVEVVQWDGKVILDLAFETDHFDQ